MFKKGKLSFILLWVLNPIVILFYQNCSTLPSAQGTTRNEGAIEQKSNLAATSGDRWPACVSITASRACAD